MNSKKKPIIIKTSIKKHINKKTVNRATSNTSYTSPAIKWVGGKTQSLDQINAIIPRKIITFIEPFLGGGSVLLMLLDSAQRGNISIENYIAADNNAFLINMYNCIQNETSELLTYLNALKSEFLSITSLNVTDKKTERSPTTLIQAMLSRESYYYWQRNRYNKLTKTYKAGQHNNELAVLLIFLNKTGFRGLYREGPNGYNVPYGNYKNPEIYNESHINYMAKLLKPVTFITSQFQNIISMAQPGDFVYLDPPYVPEKQTSFTSYIKDGFKEHHELFIQCTKLKDTKIDFVMSNSNTLLVTSYFTLDKRFTIDIIDCKRAINSKNPNARTLEVFIH